MSEIKSGAAIEVAYPFVRTTFTEFDNEGSAEVLSWKPGTRNVDRWVETWGGYREPDIEAVADAMGVMILTVIDTFKPGKFPTRVFFTRKWRDPDGREFGKGACRIMTIGQFKSRGNGFAHKFRMATPDEISAAVDELRKAA